MATILEQKIIPTSQSSSRDIEGKVQYSHKRRVIYDEIVSQAKVHADFVSTLWANFIASDVSDTTVNLKSFQVSCVSDNGRIWEVTQNYERLENGTGDEEDPVDVRVKYRPRAELVEVVYDYDPITGNAIVNSAGDPFDPPLTDQIPALFMNVEWNTASNLSSLLVHIGKTNSDSWQGFGADTWMITSFHSEEVPYNDTVYYKNTLDCALKTSKWRPIKVLNVGFREKIDGELKNIKIKGQDATAPVALDADGTAVTDGSDPIFLEFNTKEQVSISSVFGV